MRGRLACLLLAAALVLGSCAGRGLSPSASVELQGRVSDLRSAVQSGDRGSAEAKLAEIRRAVKALEAEGAISPAGADRIFAAVEAVEAHLDLLPAPAQEGPPTEGGGEDEEEDDD